MILLTVVKVDINFDMYTIKKMDMAVYITFTLLILDSQSHVLLHSHHLQVLNMISH